MNLQPRKLQAAHHFQGPKSTLFIRHFSAPIIISRAMAREGGYLDNNDFLTGWPSSLMRIFHRATADCERIEKELNTALFSPVIL